MTTDSQKASEAEKDEEQSFLPTVLAGAGILAVAALLIFWPSDDKAGGKDGGDAADKGAAADGAQADGADPMGRGAGLGSREVSPASQPHSNGRRNSMLKSGAQEMAQVPTPPPEDPPPDATVDEKIAFYEKRLEQALVERERRKGYVEKLPARKASLEASENAEQALRAFESRKQRVEANYERAKKDVEEIENKLAELRG